MSRHLRVAPDTEMGWTHVWDGGAEQVPLTDQQAHTLTYLGLIEWSGIYRVYRPVSPTSLDTVKSALGLARG